MDKPCVGPLLFAPACIAVCLAAFGLAFGPARYHIQLGGGELTCTCILRSEKTTVTEK